MQEFFKKFHNKKIRLETWDDNDYVKICPEQQIEDISQGMFKGVFNHSDAIWPASFPINDDWILYKFEPCPHCDGTGRI